MVFLELMSGGCFPHEPQATYAKMRNNEDQRDVTCREHNTMMNKAKLEKYGTLQISDLVFEICLTNEMLYLLCVRERLQE